MKASELQQETIFTRGKDVSEVNENDEPPGRSLSAIPKNPLIPNVMVISDRSQNFLHHFFPGVTDKDWNNWLWQVRNSYTSLSQLSSVVTLDENEIRPREGVNDILPIRITPYYASLLDKEDSLQAIRRTVIPVFDEFLTREGEASDPLSEGCDSPVPNLVHRYPDRVLLLATGFCSTYCRYCTRSHMVAKDKCHIGKSSWLPALEYIRHHPEIRDVLISGGDALSMTDSHLDYLLSNLRKIAHIEIIRIGTKVPVVLPQRITRSLVGILKKYHPLYISIHFTHPGELTPEVAQACERLADAGIPLGSQTVLLKGINDTVETMRSLMQGLLKIRVRPYYLYQCDPILGFCSFSNPCKQGSGDYRRLTRPYFRLCHPALCN